MESGGKEMLEDLNKDNIISKDLWIAYLDITLGIDSSNLEKTLSMLIIRIIKIICYRGEKNNDGGRRK
jgi:hypothetical protein